MKKTRKTVILPGRRTADPLIKVTFLVLPGMKKEIGARAKQEDLSEAQWLRRAVHRSLAKGA